MLLRIGCRPAAVATIEATDKKYLIGKIQYKEEARG